MVYVAVFLFSVKMRANNNAKYSTARPITPKHHVVDLAARLMRTNTGAPKAIPVPLPETRLLAAGVLKSGSISLNKRIPELMVPVSIPNILKNPSS